MAEEKKDESLPGYLVFKDFPGKGGTLPRLVTLKRPFPKAQEVELFVPPSDMSWGPDVEAIKAGWEKALANCKAGALLVIHKERRLTLLSTFELSYDSLFLKSCIHGLVKFIDCLEMTVRDGRMTEASAAAKFHNMLFHSTTLSNWSSAVAVSKDDIDIVHVVRAIMREFGKEYKKAVLKLRRGEGRTLEPTAPPTKEELEKIYYLAGCAWKKLSPGCAMNVALQSCPSFVLTVVPNVLFRLLYCSYSTTVRYYRIQYFIFLSAPPPTG